MLNQYGVDAVLFERCDNFEKVIKSRIVTTYLLDVKISLSTYSIHNLRSWEKSSLYKVLSSIISRSAPTSLLIKIIQLKVENSRLERGLLIGRGILKF